MSKIIVKTLTAIIATVLIAIPLMFLWNWLMPLIFGLPKINLLVAIGLRILTEFLFSHHSDSEKS